MFQKKTMNTRTYENGSNPYGNRFGGSGGFQDSLNMKETGLEKWKPAEGENRSCLEEDFEACRYVHPESDGGLWQLRRLSCCFPNRRSLTKQNHAHQNQTQQFCHDSLLQSAGSEPA